jgi:hypothetical protein
MLNKISVLWLAFGLIFSFSAFSEEGATIIYGPFNIFWCKKGAYCYWPIKYML